MGLLQHTLRSMGRRPLAKRRFNLLLEQPAMHRTRQKKRSVLAPFVLSASIPLTGIWQIQSDLDPALTQPHLPARIAGITEDRSVHSGPLADASMTPEGVDPTETRGGMLYGSDTHAAFSGPSSASRDRRRAEPLRQASSVLPKDRVFYRKAQGYHRQNDLERASEMYRRVLRENPAHRQALLNLVSIYMEQSAYAEAYPLVQELVSREPGNPQALVNLAVAEIGLGRPQRAIPHLDKALTLEDPPRFKIYFHRGVALSRLQRLGEAIIWYKESEDLDPGHAPLLFNMAVTFDKLERYEEALDCYTRFLTAGGASTPQERRNVEARIGVLVAYLTEEPESSSEEGAH